jgi:hypothetical protein
METSTLHKVSELLTAATEVVFLALLKLAMAMTFVKYCGAGKT